MNRLKNDVAKVTDVSKGIRPAIPKSSIKLFLMTALVAFTASGTVEAQNASNQDSEALVIVNHLLEDSFEVSRAVKP